MNKTDEIILLGGGGHGAELLSYLDDLSAAGSPVRLLGVIDDGKPPGPWETSQVLGGLPVFVELIVRGHHVRWITAVGNNRIRMLLVEKAEKAGGARPAWTLIHPRASVGRACEVGEGTLLAPGAIVTTRTRIGRHSIINVKASVSHDCAVGDFVNINPSATICGNVKIGDGAFIGAGATVINGVSVGAWSVVGAGAAVVRDIPERVTAVGVPARVIKQHEPKE